MRDTDYLEFELTLWCKRNNENGLGLWSLIQQGRGEEAGKILDKLKAEEFTKFLEVKRLDTAKAKLDEYKYTLPEHNDREWLPTYRAAEYAIVNKNQVEAWHAINELSKFL